MGTWGWSSSENDNIMDWIGDLSPSSVAPEVDRVFGRVAERGANGYLETLDCCLALAAAELVAAALGHPTESAPPQVATLQSHFDEVRLPALVQSARAVIDRIESESELRELQEESGSLEEWMDCLDDLRARLGT